MQVCKRVFSVGFGPGLDSMLLATPQNWVAVPLGRRDRWVQFAQTVAHQPRACCIRLVHIFFFCSAISSINLFPASMVPSPNGLHRYCSWYASYNVFVSSVRPGI